MTNARALAAAALLVPCAAGAQPVLGLRLGFAAPAGEVAADMPMSDVATGQVPVELDALWEFHTPLGRLQAGGYGSYGFGLAGSCAPAARCSASSLRLGALAAVAFDLPWKSIAGWAGAGAGFEWTGRESDGSGGEIAWRYRGAEFVSLQGGAELRLGRRFALGPFLQVSLGRYSTMSLDTPVESGTAEIAAKRFHAWLGAGVRGTVDLGAAR